MPIDEIGLYILPVAAVLGVIACLWLLVVAFKQGVWWGLGVFFFPPLALVFAVRHFKSSRGPLGLFLAAGVLVAGALVAGQFIPRDPRIKFVNGREARHAHARRGERLRRTAPQASRRGRAADGQRRCHRRDLDAPGRHGPPR